MHACIYSTCVKLNSSLSVCLHLLLHVGPNNLASLEEKVEEMFYMQQQMLQHLQSIDGQIKNVLRVLGQQRQRDIYSAIPQNQFSTSGLYTLPGTSIPAPEPLTPTGVCVSDPPTMPTQGMLTSGGSLTLPAASNHTSEANAMLPADSLTVGKSKENLITPSEVITKYPRLRGDGKMGELATKLARECFFGKELMRQSTVLGFKDFPALPADDVKALKKTILSVCPEYHCNPHGFESLWKKCVDAINHACSKLRK